VKDEVPVTSRHLSASSYRPYRSPSDCRRPSRPEYSRLPLVKLALLLAPFVESDTAPVNRLVEPSVIVAEAAEW